jgi:hypothetical protein
MQKAEFNKSSPGSTCVSNIPCSESPLSLSLSRPTRWVLGTVGLVMVWVASGCLQNFSETKSQNSSLKSCRHDMFPLPKKLDLVWYDIALLFLGHRVPASCQTSPNQDPDPVTSTETTSINDRQDKLPNASILFSLKLILARVQNAIKKW